MHQDGDGERQHEQESQDALAGLGDEAVFGLFCGFLCRGVCVGVDVLLVVVSWSCTCVCMLVCRGVWTWILDAWSRSTDGSHIQTNNSPPSPNPTKNTRTAPDSASTPAPTDRPRRTHTPRLPPHPPPVPPAAARPAHHHHHRRHWKTTIPPTLPPPSAAPARCRRRRPPSCCHPSPLMPMPLLLRR